VNAVNAVVVYPPQINIYLLNIHIFLEGIGDHCIHCSRGCLGGAPGDLDGEWPQ
jgi:hypothetical protein